MLYCFKDLYYFLNFLLITFLFQSKDIPSICECNEPIRELHSNQSSVQFVARTNHNRDVRRMLSRDWWKNLNEDKSGDLDIEL